MCFFNSIGFLTCIENCGHFFGALQYIFYIFEIILYNFTNDINQNHFKYKKFPELKGDILPMLHISDK